MLRTPSKSCRGSHKPAADRQFSVESFVFLQEPDLQPQLVHIATTPELAQAFAEGFNYAQSANEGTAIVGSNAAMTVLKAGGES